MAHRLMPMPASFPFGTAKGARGVCAYALTTSSSRPSLAVRSLAFTPGGAVGGDAPGERRKALRQAAGTTPGTATGSGMSSVWFVHFGKVGFVLRGVGRAQPNESRTAP